MTRLKKYLASGVLMTCVSLALRGLTVAFNAYVSRKIGAETLGLYTLLGSIYGFALTLALSGINLTATRLVSDALGENDIHKARASMTRCIGYSLFFGSLACALLLALAEPVALHVLKDGRIIKPLRLAGATLPLISVTACLNGYFTAIRKVYKNAAVQIGEQLARIFICAALLELAVGRDMESCCTALVLGGALSEILSFSLSLLLYVFEKQTDKVAERSYGSCKGVTKKMLSIALPLALSTYFRSALLTLEHILIPMGIEKSGENRANALAAYGTLQSMVMPLVLFPAALTQSFSSLLVPELARLKIQENMREVRYVAQRVCHLALLFGVGASGVMIYFADGLGMGIYGSAEAGGYIRLVAHIVPIMYLDTTVDNMLKGLGEQLYTMNINILDTLCSLVMVWILIPKFGGYGYIILIMVSEIFNAGASIYKLVKVTGMRFSVLRWFILPSLSIIAATHAVSKVSDILGFSILAAIALSVAVYFLLLRVIGSLNKEECAWIKGFFKKSA